MLLINVALYAIQIFKFIIKITLTEICRLRIN